MSVAERASDEDYHGDFQVPPTSSTLALRARISELESDLRIVCAVLADARAASARDLEARRTAQVLADRLAAGLREALDGWESCWTSENNDEPPARIGELRKLVQP